MFSNCNSVVTIRNRVQFMIFIVIGWAYALLFAYFSMVVNVWLARRALIILFRNCNRTWNRIWMLHRCLWSLSWTTAVAFVLPLASQLWILLMICKVSGVFNLCWNTVVASALHLASQYWILLMSCKASGAFIYSLQYEIGFNACLLRLGMCLIVRLPATVANARLAWGTLMV